MKRAVDSFLNHLVVERGFSRNTLEAYRNDLYQFLDFLEDHLAQTIQARLMARRGEQPAAATLLQYDEESGFTFTRQLTAALEDFELHRTDYPTFERFFPHLMDSFR